MPFYSEEKLKDNKDGYFIVVSPRTEMGDTEIIEVKGSVQVMRILITGGAGFIGCI